MRLTLTLATETAALRAELARLVARDDRKTRLRYSLPPASLGERLLYDAGGFLHSVGLSRGYLPGYHWRSSLKHARQVEQGKLLLIWGVGAEHDVLRPACQGLACHLEATPGFLPVLVTEVADFAYYSRLGWLIEYVPNLRGEGESYPERKLAYLAWRYRDALALPVVAGLATAEEWKGLVK